MLPIVILGLALVVGLVLLLSAFARADVQALARGLRRSVPALGLVVVGAVLLWLIATGRLGGLFALAPALLPLLLIFRRMMRQAKAARGPASGQRSGVRTRYLRVELDHDSGAMEGEVVEGPFQGRRLDDLSRGDLLTLLQECRRADAPSAAILETYLDRHFPDWRSGGPGSDEAGAERGDATTNAGMTREEAYAILGLEPGATPEEIREAHRRLMLKNHPDRGGSSYLAARINQAKDVLSGT